MYAAVATHSSTVMPPAHAHMPSPESAKASPTCGAAIARAVRGSVVKLFRHPAGSAVVADLYSELPPAERNALLAEFYSREHAVLGGPASAAGQIGSLVDAWEGFDAAKRRAVLKHLIAALAPIIEKAYVDPLPMHRCSASLLARRVRVLHRPLRRRTG